MKACRYALFIITYYMGYSSLYLFLSKSYWQCALMILCWCVTFFLVCEAHNEEERLKGFTYG